MDSALMQCRLPRKPSRSQSRTITRRSRLQRSNCSPRSAPLNWQPSTSVTLAGIAEALGLSRPCEDGRNADRASACAHQLQVMTPQWARNKLGDRSTDVRVHLHKRTWWRSPRVFIRVERLPPPIYEDPLKTPPVVSAVSDRARLRARLVAEPSMVSVPR